MATEIPHIGVDEPPSVFLEVLDDVGAVIVDGMIDPAEMDQIGKDLEFHISGAAVDPPLVNAGAEFFFAGVRHVTGLAAKSPAFVNALLLHPALLALADTWFAPIASGYQLNIAHLLVRDPSAERQLFHRDEDVWIHLQHLWRGADPHPEVQLACITALCEFSPDVGATLVVPGSHRWDRDRVPQNHEVTAATMSAGSSIIYRGSVLHAGGTNRSDRPRPAIHHSYVVGWLRTEESGLLSTPPDVARHLPARAQELVGYGCHDAIDQLGGYLGVVELQNPVDLLVTGKLPER